MRKDRNLGVLFSPLLFVTGTYLISLSTDHAEWYLDFYLLAGATIAATGLMTAHRAIQRRISFKRMEQHVRRHS